MRAATRPLVVSYCHCTDCRRITGAPVAAFAAFELDDLTFSPALDDGVTIVDGVRRWFCRHCGSPLAAIFDYLPGQIYIPVGVLDQAAQLSPHLHSHSGAQLPWLHIHDDLPRAESSARASLASREERS